MKTLPFLFGEFKFLRERIWQHKLVGKNPGEALNSLEKIEDPIYEVPEMKLHGLVSNFHIHLSVSGDLKVL